MRVINTVVNWKVIGLCDKHNPSTPLRGLRRNGATGKRKLICHRLPNSICSNETWHCGMKPELLSSSSVLFWESLVNKILQGIPFFWTRTNVLNFTLSFFPFNPRWSIYGRGRLLFALTFSPIKSERKCYSLHSVPLYYCGTNLTWNGKGVCILNSRNGKK